MRTVLNGKGADVTSAIAAWLGRGNSLALATLYLIGEVEDPQAVRLTDWQTPLTWSVVGDFAKATIKRGKVESKIGFQVSKLDVEWTPNNFAFTQDINSTSPYQQMWLGKFDGMTFRAWTAYMPVPGDVDVSGGAAPLFGGRIGNSTVERGKIKFTVDSFLDVVNQQVPGSVIEVLNSIAGFKGATPPAGFSTIPTFTVAAGTVPGLINATCTSPAGEIFAQDAFQGGFIQFTSGSLAGMWSAVESNFGVTGPFNQFLLFQRFPWAPVVGDAFYASATFPINQADGQYFGFPYVPDPSSAF